jgi:hypothetical protein
MKRLPSKYDISEPPLEPTRDQMKVLRALIREFGREKVAELAKTIDATPRSGRRRYWGSYCDDQWCPSTDKWNIVWWLEQYRSKDGIDDAVHDLYDLLVSKEDQNRLTVKKPDAYQRWAKGIKNLYYRHRQEVPAHERREEVTRRRLRALRTGI